MSDQELDKKLQGDLLIAIELVCRKHNLTITNTNGIVRHGSERTFAVDIDPIENDKPSIMILPQDL